MHNPFELTPEERATTTGKEQLDMFTRLVDFVNARLSEYAHSTSQHHPQPVDHRI